MWKVVEGIRDSAVSFRERPKIGLSSKFIHNSIRERYESAEMLVR